MPWTPQEIGLSPDDSCFLAVYDSLGTGSPVGGGASYQCNVTCMGFMLNLPAIKPAVLLQSTQVVYDFNAGEYHTFSATFTNPTTPGSLLIAIFTAQFGSALFNMGCTDSTLVSWNNVFPTNGHVPGESNTLQVFIAIGVGGQPTVTLTQIGLLPTYSNMTTGSLVLLEYSGPNGTVAEYTSNFNVGGPATLTLSPLATNPGDLLFQAISLMPACPNPNVVPIGGGFVAPPPTNIMIPPQNLGVVSLPFCFSNKCVIFD
jgi:hypothetical protein